MDLFRKISELIKKYFNKYDKKKLVENSIIIIIIGVIIIIAGGSLFNKSSEKEPPIVTAKEESAETAAKNISDETRDGLEEKLEKILSQIEGVGKVSVMITFVSGQEVVPASDIRENQKETGERDSDGGSRNISERDYESKIAYEDLSGGVKKPIIIKNLYPVVKGVVVAAEGAGDPRVKERISKAVQVLMDVPMHKVQVFERKK
jgi:stage III sporulation protein AG